MNTKEIRKRKGFYFCLLAFTSVLLILLLSIVSLFWPTKRFSASERRNLTQRPKLSYEGIVDGTFSNEVESYLADQYPRKRRSEEGREGKEGRSGWPPYH